MTDWPKLIRELESAGVSIYKLSLMVGAYVKQVQRWQRGVEPKHSAAKRLIKLHRELVSKRTKRSHIAIE